LLEMATTSAMATGKATRLVGRLLLLMAGAFLTGATGAALSATPPEFWLIAGAVSAVGLLVLPWTTWELVRPFLEVCGSNDHISEIALPLLLVGPPVVFAIVVCAALLLFRRRTTFTLSVAGAVPASLVTFAVMHPIAVKALTQLYRGCPSLGWG